VQGSGGGVPPLDKNQQAVGDHDNSPGQADTGTAASGARRAVGAGGHATGGKGAFAGAPRLHAAAPEARPTTPQPARRQHRGVGEAGDAYERHADAVAHAVVQGRSAEALLEAQTHARPATAPSQPYRTDAVQRITTPDKPEITNLNAAASKVRQSEETRDLLG